MKYYVYITINLINGKQYIGDHSTSNLNDGYLGSGKPYFENAKKKYGKENFKRKILKFFDSKQEAFDAQEKYIKEYGSLFPNGYNLSPKGGNKGKGSVSDETRKKMRDAKLGKPHPHKGHKITDEVKEKIRIGNLGKPSWIKGKTQSEETKQKLRKFALERFKNKENHPFYRKKHTKESIEKMKLTFAKNEHQKGEKNSMYGKKHSKKTKQKMKENHADFSGKNNPMYGISSKKIKCL